MDAPALNDDSDGDLDLPELEPVQLRAQQGQLPAGGNPFSPLRSPAQPDPNAVLEQLAATTQLLSNIVLGQNSGRERAPYASFSEANKVLNRPSEFGSLSHEADLAAWQDWSHSFRTWLTFADGEYERLLKVIEDNIDHAVALEYESEEIRDKSQKLYAVLSGLLKHKPRTFLKQIPNRNGLELWRQLLQTYAPKTRARSLAVLNALTGAPAFSKDKSLQEQVFALERMSAEYTRISGRSVGEDILLGTLLRCLPANIRQHCQLVMNDRTTYDQLRAYVLSYEITTTTWSASRVQQALGVTSQPAEQGATPMEIDRLAGKGKYGKGKDGKGKSGKGKDSKSKGKDAKGADAGKGKDKHPKGKDKSDRQPRSADRNQCLYCGKQGHWKRDCKRYKADVKAGKVRAVGAEDAASSVSTVAPSHSASQVAPAASSSKGRVARIEEVDLTSIGAWDDDGGESGEVRMIASAALLFDIGDDAVNIPSAHDVVLEYELLSLPSDALLHACFQARCRTDQVRYDAANPCKFTDQVRYDAANPCKFTDQVRSDAANPCKFTDQVRSDAANPCKFADQVRYDAANPCKFTDQVRYDAANPCKFADQVRSSAANPYSAVAQVEVLVSRCLRPDMFGAVRAVSCSHGEDIILDSGADVSALPEVYATVGEPAGPAAQRFVDASGRLLRSKGFRIAEVQIGSVKFKEKFLIGGVTCPLLSLGKLYQAGFYVIPAPSGAEGFVLTNGSACEPVHLKRQSLCTKGHVRVIHEQAHEVQQQPAVRAIENVVIQDPLLRLDASGWQRIGHRCYALLSFGQSYVDTTLVPLTELLWYRTTLIRRNGEWALIEFSEDVSGLSDRTAAFESPGVEQVITIAHDDNTLSPNQLGFATPESSHGVPASGASPSDDAPVVQEAAGVGDLDVDPPQAVDQAAPIAPAADGGGEELPPDREAVDSVTVGGVTIDRHSSLRVMRAALVSLGLSKNGSKAQCWERLTRHIKEAELLREQQVDHTLRAEMSRPPAAPPIPRVPCEEDRARHALTHEPYAPWCETCVRFRGRQDGHPTEAAHGAGDRSVLSFDFGYCSRESGDDAKDRLTVLFLHDRRTKAVHAIPAAQKGGSSLSYLVTEAARFAIWLGHRSLRLRCDNEPSVLAVQSGLLKALRNLGIDVSKDNSPIESHQSNGPVEQVVGSVRQHAAVLMHELEVACGATEGQVLFSPQHPVYGWSLCHACWLRNRYTPMHGTTAYEAVTDSVYSGSICRFGEKVLGYLRPSGKSSARWRQGIWLGKATGSDTHIVGMPGGVFVTRSVRRFGDGFDSDLAASFDVCVWEHGLSSIGGKLVLGRKKPAPPVAMPVPMQEGAMPPDIPADHRHDEVRSPSQAAGTDSPTVTNPEYSPSFSPSSQSAKSPSAAVSKHTSDAAMQQADASASAEAGSPVAPVPVVVEDSLGLSENPRPAKAARTIEVAVPDEGDHDMSGSGQVSLVTTAGYVLDDNRADEVLVISGDETPCVAHVMQVSYEHEDESVPLAFDGETLEELEDYDESFLDDQIGDSELLPELCFPRTSEIEPCLSPDELASLDEIADAVEIDRLKKMSVLLPEEAASGEQYAGQSPTKLTTRMVRTWREKTVGNEPVWYRRSRYVAREYAWLDVRHDLFAPASTAVSNRLLPIHFLSHEQDASDPWIMASMDISDAYLSVLQTRLVIVQHAGVSYVLGRVLPGQRDGSKAWYEDFSSFLGEELGFEKCTALPSLIRESTTQFAMQLHVDDMLGVGSRRYLLEKLKPTLESRYRVSISILESPGDSISFLKRHHKLLPGGKMLLTPSARHFEKLFTVMKIDERSAPKKTPYASVLDEVDHSALLSADEAKAFRCAIGILLYLAVDLIECQGAIRALSSYMSSPTRNAQTALKHLLKYLLDGQHHGLLLCRDNIHCGRSGELSPSTSRAMCIESYSDADWATHKGNRRSVSSSMVFVSGCLLYSSARTQRVIALSSGESELLSATSSLCDALFIRQLVAFLADCDPPQVHHFTDATAAKSMMERSGVGRVRHLSVRVLWTQQLVADKVISLHKVDTCRNVADLNTKALPRHRMMMLLNLLGGWDTLRDEPIGLNDIAEFEYKQAMKQAVRAVRTTTSGAVNKQVLQGIVLAVASALSRATDSSDEDGDSSDQDVELPQWANRILVWVLGLWVRDDSGVSIIDMLTSHAAPILCMCILMLFVAMCFRFWCARPPSRQVQVQVSDQRQHGAVSVRFDQNLNVQVGVAAPGTPANPLAVDSDDDAVSPPHVLHAMRKGARSKASARPGPRCDEPASSSDTRAGVEPPPPEAFVRAPSSAPPTPEGSVGSTGSFRDAHGYQVAVARRLEHPQDAVWVSTYGRCYHRLRCFKLDGCDRIKRLPLADAVARGYRPCKKCAP